MSFDLSIVIPCYNEEKLLAHSVDELVAVMKVTPYRYELIFVDDRSHDGTVALIRTLQQRFSDVEMVLIEHAQNQGRGRTATDGFKAARGRVAGYLDIDLEVHARYVPAMVDAIDRLGYDAAIGWRIYQASRSGLFRAASSKLYHRLAQSLLGLSYQDTETGYKFFRRDALVRILDRPTNAGWFWDTEIMAYCALEGFRVAEVPCVFMRRSDKISSVRVVRDSIDYARCLWAFRRRLKQLAAGRAAMADASPSRRETNAPRG